MADPLSILGVAYPVAHDFVAVIKEMRKVYNEIRFAKKNLMKVIERTEMIGDTYDFFRRTINAVRSITELAPMFQQHKRLIRRVRRESRRILARLKRITGTFWFLIRDKPISRSDEYIAQFDWYWESRKTIPPLFQDMEVLEKSMKTIGILVNIQMSLAAYQRDTSNSLMRVQATSFQIMLNIEIRTLKNAQRAQENMTPPTQSPGRRFSAQEVLQFLETETSRLPSENAPLTTTSSVDSRPSSVSPEVEVRSPATTSSTPSHLSVQDEVSEVEPVVQPEIEREIEETSMRRPRVRRRTTQSEPPQHTLPLSPSSSFLEPVVEIPNDDEGSPVQELHGQIQDQGRGDQGTYMQTPLFGPPRLAPRPRAGQTPPEFPGPSNSSLGQQRGRPQSQYQSNPNSRRRNGSSISVYGNEGEVTHAHLTGYLGLPSGTRRRRARVRSPKKMEIALLEAMGAKAADDQLQTAIKHSMEYMESPEITGLSTSAGKRRVNDLEEDDIYSAMKKTRQLLEENGGDKNNDYDGNLKQYVVKPDGISTTFEDVHVSPDAIKALETVNVINGI